ncbi:MAG TPA: TetR/AcrR family transcriptional regulator [Blastocatellia bacterium]|nr:TetR/AcrR family transcriptional regulator [Blastocatellia bacterium]
MNKKVEQGNATRHQIVAAARQLFATLGYEATSIEAVLRESGVSRGALYHHFDSKEALFSVVLQEVEAEIAHVVSAAARGIDDPSRALAAGCGAWLGLASDPAIRQIALIDAPSVVGWQKWRQADESYGFGLLKTGLSAAATAGRMRPELVDVFAHILLAALAEVALVIARAPDPAAATGVGRIAIEELIGRLLAR